MSCGRFTGYGWGEVYYSFRGRVLSRKVRSSLPLLYDCLRPDVVVVLVLDTVVEGDVEGYLEVRERVSGRYRDFIEDELGLRLGGGKLSVIVAPGVGSFPNGFFLGDLKDFHVYILYELVKVFLRYWVGGGRLEFYLDLTHGMNYMPTLTYRVVREIAGISAFFGDVRFSVYNSEPYTAQSSNLEIHVLEDAVMLPSPSRDGLRDKPRLLEPRSLSESERRELDRLQSRLVGEAGFKGLTGMSRTVNAFLGSLVNGLPLALLTFLPASSGLEYILEEAERLYFDYTRVEPHEGRLRVERRVSLSRDYAALAKAYYTAKLLENLGFTCGREAMLDELDRIREKLFSKDERLNALISIELERIRGVRNRLPVGKWVRLNEVFEEGGGFDLRNFLAHAGFEWNITEVKKEEGKVILRYCEDELPGIRRHSAKGIR